MNKSVTIKGLKTFEDYDLSSDDTNPGLIRVWFSVESVFMPALSEQEGRRVNKNFIYLNWEMELGRSTGRKRLNDKVEFNDATQKWEIVSLAANGASFIKQFPNEWNAFYENVDYDEAGTPIELLFKNDPARADLFKHFGIKTIERLAAISESDAQSIGMGALDDKRRAERFIAKANEAVTSTQFNAEMDALKEQTASQAKVIEDLTNKLTILLQEKLKGEEAPAPKRGKSKAEQVGA